MTKPTWENTAQIILAGTLMNGFIQGQTKNKIDDGVIYEALKELNKLFSLAQQQARAEERVEICEMLGKDFTDSYNKTLLDYIERLQTRILSRKLDNLSKIT